MRSNGPPAGEEKNQDDELLEQGGVAFVIVSFDEDPTTPIDPSEA